MRWIPVVVMFLCAPAATAEVYSWIDEQGRVIYSDKPVPGAKRIEKRGLGKAGAEPNAPDGRERGYTGPYQAFDILKPEQGAISTEMGSRLEVSLLVVPGLLPEHQIEVVLDGAPLGEGERNTQFLLQGMSVGTHQLQARVVDADGGVVATTNTIDFHFRPSAPAGEQLETP